MSEIVKDQNSSESFDSFSKFANETVSQGGHATLTLDFDKIPEMESPGIVQSIIDVFTGGKYQETYLQVYEQKLGILKFRDRAEQDLVAKKLEVFKILCLEWQQRQVEIADRTIILKNGDFEIQCPKDIDPKTLLGIMAKLSPK